MRSVQISFVNKKICIIGAGNQALRKGKQFIDEGAKVIYISPSFHVEILAQQEDGLCILLEKTYEAEDIKDGFLVYACTDNRELNHQIVLDANEKRILSGSVHRDSIATYRALQFVDYPHMHVAVSTNGAYPSYNQEILDEFAQSYHNKHHHTLENLRKSREDKLPVQKKKKGVLVVSYGTTVEETRKKNIETLEQDVKNAMQSYHLPVYCAYSSRHICKKLNQQQVYVMTIEEAIQRMYEDGITEIVVLSTYLLHGKMYDQLQEQLASAKRMVRLQGGYSLEITSVTKPLLMDTQMIKNVLTYIHESVRTYDQSNGNRVLEETLLEAKCEENQEAFVMMGHGTDGNGNLTFAAINYIAQEQGYNYMFVGAMDGYPSIDSMIQDIQKAGYSTVVLMPLMLVAGKHARKDMASDAEHSWKTQLEKAGIEVRVLMQGLGEIEGIRSLYLSLLLEELRVLN